MNIKILGAVVHGGKILAKEALHVLEDKVAQDLISRGLAVQAPAPAVGGQSGQPGAPAPQLRTDGPTIEEFVAAGYEAKAYPPTGYAEKPSAGLTRFKAGGPVILPQTPSTPPEPPAAPASDAPQDQQQPPATPDASAPKGSKKK